MKNDKPVIDAKVTEIQDVKPEETPAQENESMNVPAVADEKTVGFVGKIGSWLTEKDAKHQSKLADRKAKKDAKLKVKATEKDDTPTWKKVAKGVAIVGAIAGAGALAAVALSPSEEPGSTDGNNQPLSLPGSSTIQDAEFTEIPQAAEPSPSNDEGNKVEEST